MLLFLHTKKVISTSTWLKLSAIHILKQWQGKWLRNSITNIKSYVRCKKSVKCGERMDVQHIYDN